MAADAASAPRLWMWLFGSIAAVVDFMVDPMLRSNESAAASITDAAVVGFGAGVVLSLTGTVRRGLGCA